MLLTFSDYWYSTHSLANLVAQPLIESRTLTKKTHTVKFWFLKMFNANSTSKMLDCMEAKTQRPDGLD